MNRNEFLKLSVNLIAGFSVPQAFANFSMIAGLESFGERVNATLRDDSNVAKGLNALARAHQMSSMAGHLGASVLAGFFLAKQRPDLDPEVFKGIKTDLARVMGGESVFGARMSKKAKLADRDLFKAFAKENSNASLIDNIAEALEKNIKLPRESGHNVIFGSIAIRALKQHPEFATPSIVDGICKLMGLFNNAHPGSGNYGKAKGRIYGNKITLPDDDGTPLYKDVAGMVDAVLDEIINQDPKVRRQGFGGLVHVNNHAAAIVDLAEYGYAELVPTAIASHRQHLRLWRNLPNLVDELGRSPLSKFSPFTADYWTSGNVPDDRALLTHRVKTMFGFDELIEAIEDDQKEQLASDKLRYLM